MKRLILIDSHAIIHRAFHALPPLSAPDGTPTNAVYGFASILLKLLKDFKPDYVVAAFDHKGPTFRHVAFERYKATRIKAPDELYQQIPLVKDLLLALGIPTMDKQGYEADDIIGTIAAGVRRKHPDIEIIIVTGDLDTLQLIDDHTKVFTLRKGVSDTVLYDARGVKERYGLGPSQLIDFKGLSGDPSDNIPGVRGIGEKTAAELLQVHGSIEKIYQALKKNKLNAKPRVVAALKTHEADALFSKTLVTIDRHAPIRFLLAAARFRKSRSQEKIRPVFERLGFYSLLRRMDESRVSRLNALSSQKELSLSLRRVASLGRVRRRDHALVLPYPEQRVAVVAVSPGHVYELPMTPAAFPPAWFAGPHPIYVFDIKLLFDFLPQPSRAPVYDLKVMWWLSDPGRRTYEPAILAAPRLGERPIEPAAIAPILFSLAPVLEKRLKDEELWKVYQEFEAPLTPLLVAMERVGIQLDGKPLARLSQRMAGELVELEQKIYKDAGCEFNIHSPRQLAHVLFDTLGLAGKGIRKTEKLGMVSTRETELVKLRSAHPVIDKLLRFREISKLKSTYVDALPRLAGPDGRIHTTWNQTGTATGRLSSANPNLQNIPTRSEFSRAIRAAFVVAPSWQLVTFDYSQLELRLAADLAPDEKMIAAFQSGQDIHRLTAAEVNNISLQAVSAEQRQKAKALNFGVLYGMGARVFAESADISRDEANFFIEEYFRDFSGIARFIEKTKVFARIHGFTQTFFGRKRFFPDITATNFRIQREAERQAVNHPIQGTAADIMKKAMIVIDRFLEKEKLKSSVRLLLQIHDELLFEMQRDVLTSVLPEIQKIMEGIWQGKVRLEVRVKQGRNWAMLE